MTKEDKQLLLADLCARLPYGVQVKSSRRRCVITLSLDVMTDFHIGCSIKSYLRPMSSMTEEERKEYNEYLFYGSSIGLMSNTGTAYELIDWLNAHHFDYRGLIEKNLALEAPKGIYNLND